MIDDAPEDFDCSLLERKKRPTNGPDRSRSLAPTYVLDLAVSMHALVVVRD